MSFVNSAPSASPRPGKVQALAVLTLASGITNVLWPLFLILLYLLFVLATFGIGLIFCLLVPLAVLPIVLGVFEVLYSGRLFSAPARPVQPSQGIAVLEVVCALTGNAVAVAAGIVALILYNDPEVKAYFARAGMPAPLQPSAPAAPALPPVEPLPESPIKMAEAIVPAGVVPPAPEPQLAAGPVRTPESAAPAAVEAEPAKAESRPGPAARPRSRSAAAKPAATAPKAKATAKVKPAARPKSKKPAAAASKPKPASKAKKTTA